MNHQQITLINLRKLPVNGKFIVIFTQGACHIISVVAGLVFFSHDRNVMVCPIHSRTHQIHRAGIHANILLIGMLFMDCLCHQTAIRSQHKSAQLRIDRHISHAGRNKHFLIDLPHTLTDDADVIGLLIRAVGNSDSAGKIDKADVSSRLFLQPDSQLKEHLRQHRIIFIGHGIAGQKRVKAEMLRAFLLQNPVSVEKLFCGHTVFGIAGIVHNIIADLKYPARIETAADGLRNIADGFLQEINMRIIVQIDNRSDFRRIGKFLRRRIIGRKHDILSLYAKSL